MFIRSSRCLTIFTGSLLQRGRVYMSKIWILVCLSVITSIFRIKNLYITPGSRQTLHIIFCWAGDDVSCHLAHTHTHIHTHASTYTHTHTHIQPSISHPIRHLPWHCIQTLTYSNTLSLQSMQQHLSSAHNIIVRPFVLLIEFATVCNGGVSPIPKPLFPQFPIDSLANNICSQTS